MNNNPLLKIDVYKLGHMEQYAPDTTKVYSYLMGRSDKNFKEMVWFGLQYYLEEYLSAPIMHWMVDEFLIYASKIVPVSTTIEENLHKLADLGYWPIEIKAVREGTVIPTKNVVMTITNTHPDFYWCVGFIESLILKVWYPCTVATTSRQYRKFVDQMFNETVDEDMNFLRPFMVHDFGYRGDTSEESAAISGAAHLVNFIGSDTVVALPFIDDYYMTTPTVYSDSLDGIMSSVPASEHSTMCSFGKDNEIEAYKNMLQLYPTGLVSIVSDTYSIWNVLTNIAVELKEDILQRDGTVVFRPDSGDPFHIICGYDIHTVEYSNIHTMISEWQVYDMGDKSVVYNEYDGTYNIIEFEHFYHDGSLRSYKIKQITREEALGCIRLLDEVFGSTVNSKGYKVLNPKIGLIYGDGMYYERYTKTMRKLKEMGYAASNLVIGIGGILRQGSRDTLGFALKATYVEIKGVPRAIKKEPVTDPGKVSHEGLISLRKYNDGYVTLDKCDWDMEGGLLETVFRNGEILFKESFYSIRERCNGKIE